MEPKNLPPTQSIEPSLIPPQPLSIDISGHKNYFYPILMATVLIITFAACIFFFRQTQSLKKQLNSALITPSQSSAPIITTPSPR